MEKINIIFDDEFPSSFTNNPVAMKLPPNLLRRYSVTVRLNEVELGKVNQSRGQLSRSSWLRSSALKQLPPSVPEVCSGQQKLATALEFFQNNRSDSFGVKPPLY